MQNKEVNMDYINLRRSIRRYKSQEVSDELIIKLLKSGMQAPSAVNQRPWFFVVTKNKDIINKLKEISNGSKNIENASCVIIPCMNKNNFKIEGMAPLDMSCSVENILLKATELKLGSLWVGIYPKEDRINKVKEILNLEDNLIPFNLIAIGYPMDNNDLKYIDRFEKERIRFI